MTLHRVNPVPTDAMIALIRDPRVGDRFIGLDETVVIEIVAIVPHNGDGLPPGCHQLVEFTDSRYGANVFKYFLGFYQKMAEAALRNGHTFHAVEDDEE